MTGIFRYEEKKLDDGVYVVRIDNRELTVAEYSSSFDAWNQLGSDYDMWAYGEPTIIEVICRLDIESIAAGAKAQE
jgi:hypothetical protein